MKSHLVKASGVALPLLVSLVMIAVLIYISNPGEIMVAFSQARLSYIILAIPLSLLIMLVYTYWWQFITIMMGEIACI
jgi:hypothetical protein